MPFSTEMVAMRSSPMRLLMPSGKRLVITAFSSPNRAPPDGHTLGPVTVAQHREGALRLALNGQAPAIQQPDPLMGTEDLCRCSRGLLGNKGQDLQVAQQMIQPSAGGATSRKLS